MRNHTNTGQFSSALAHEVEFPDWCVFEQDNVPWWQSSALCNLRPIKNMLWEEKWGHQLVLLLCTIAVLSRNFTKYVFKFDISEQPFSSQKLPDQIRGVGLQSITFNNYHPVLLFTWVFSALTSKWQQCTSYRVSQVKASCVIYPYIGWTPRLHPVTMETHKITLESKSESAEVLYKRS